MISLFRAQLFTEKPHANNMEIANLQAREYMTIQRIWLRPDQLNKRVKDEL